MRSAQGRRSTSGLNCVRAADQPSSSLEAANRLPRSRLVASKLNSHCSHCEAALTTHHESRVAGRRVGVLYILGTVFGIVGVAVTSSISGSSDILDAVAADETAIAVGALAIFLMASVLGMIPVVAYPILRRVDVLLARGYVLFRSVLEVGTYLLTAVAWLLLIPLSTATDVSGVWGEALYSLEGAATTGTIAFLVGASMFYLMLYRGRLVPRWLSLWGLIAIVPYAVPVVLGLFTETDVSTTSTVTILLDIPLGLQEMALAIWLIVKGFAPTEPAGESALD